MENGSKIINRLKQWARGIKRDVIALWIAARDPRVPWYAKTVAGLVAAYALSPIDLIPDFIPIVGYLDDLLIVPAGIMLAVRLTPADLMEEFRKQAVLREGQPRSTAAAIAVVVVWIAAASWFAWWLWPSQGLL